MIYILLACTIVIFYFTFLISNNDVMFPGCIVCIVWIFGELCVIYNADYWNVSISGKTTLIYISTILVFVLMSFFGDYLGKRGIRGFERSKKERYLTTEIPHRFIVLFTIFNLISLFIVIASVWKKAGINSMKDSNAYAVAMSQYRGSDESLPSMVKQLYKIMKCDSYVLLFFFCKRNKDRKSIFYLVPGILFCIASLSTGSRTDFLHFFIAALIVMYISMQERRCWSVKPNFKYIFGCIAAICAFLFFFNFVKTFVGRLNAADPLRYITSYAGGSIQLFDMYLDNPTPKSEQFGQLSFYSLWQNFDKLKLAAWKPTGLEFRMSNGHLIGNLYTSIRRYYQDFGLIGNYILQSLFAIFYSFWYRRIKKSNGFDNGFSIIMYSMLVSPLFLHAIDDTFFSGFLCINTIVLACITKIIYSLVQQKIRFSIKIR